MGSRADIIDAIGELEELQRNLGQIVRAADDGWRHRLVQRRRELAELMARLAAHVSSAERDLTLDLAHSLEVRAKLTSFRAALAMHQATFPAVAIVQETADYRRSVETVRETSAAFCSHLRLVLRATTTHPSSKE